MGERAQDSLNKALGLEDEFDFRAAKAIYEDLKQNDIAEDITRVVDFRLEDMDHLIAEKETYQRIHDNGKKVISEIGMNIAESAELMEILMEADAIDFDKEAAVFIPIKDDYIDQCLEKCPRNWSGDPGKNSFGTGATPPFLKRVGDNELRQASRSEFEDIVRSVTRNEDIIGIFSLPVATDKSVTAFEVAQLMEEGYSGLKMTSTKAFSDDEIKFLAGKDHWVDGTTLITSLTPMNTMISPFLRSARSGANLLLLDLTIAGSSGPGSPEALLTQIHAQVLFMMVVAQTVNPGVLCMHGGIPSVSEAGGDLSYSSPYQPLINAAMARLNNWITKLPSAQSGGSTSITELASEAVFESELSRNTLRKYGAHIVRHAMGASGYNVKPDMVALSSNFLTRGAEPIPILPQLDSAIGSLAILYYAIFISVKKLNGKQGKVSRWAFSKVYRSSSAFQESSMNLKLWGLCRCPWTASLRVESWVRSSGVS